MERLESHRAFFAQLITANVGIANPDHPVRAAFASTAREDFVGHGPWHVFTPAGYIETPSDDPALLYHDIVIALSRERQLNNGQPALHAACLAALAVKPGETIVHIGAGTGYYSAILAQLTGPNGRVLAYEIEKELAERAAQNLARRANVTVHAKSGTAAGLPQCDVIYVNAGATGPADEWLKVLRVGGRLMFPLTPAEVGGRPGPGMMLLITKGGDGFAARFVVPVAFTPCIGARDDETAARLTLAFARGDARNVRSLRVDEQPDETCWCEGKSWWLSTKPIA